jgi:hypothetical protein
MLTGHDKKGNKVELKFAESPERKEKYILTIQYVKGGGASVVVMDQEAGKKMAEEIFGKLVWEEEE